MFQSLSNFIKTIKEKPINIAVLGDVMIDERIQVKVNRISPEFPISVLSGDFRPPIAVPGGAANTCRQGNGIFPNVKSILLSPVNYYLNSICDFPRFIVSDFDLPIKKRFYDGDFPLVRWDQEPRKDLYNKMVKKYLDQIINYINTGNFNYIIMNDYGKGFFDNNVAETIISVCQKAKIPILVDPKDGDLKRWEGCNVFKPNYNEACYFLGCDNVNAQQLMKKVKSQAVVITKGKDGIEGFEEGYSNSFRYVPPPVMTNNVIGAGDNFSMFLAIGLSAGLGLQNSSILSSIASSAYIKNKCNKPISLYDLYNHIDPYNSKFVDLDYFNNRDYKLVFTNGCFDILHVGHLSTLQFAKQQGDKLVVAVNSDESIKQIKGQTRPINNLRDRMSMLASLSCVDFVVSFQESDPYNIIQKIKPDVLVKGGDYTNPVGSDIVSEVKLAPLIDGYSTTKILGSE